MWPMLLDLTRDECRRTLRRLELEAYSNMVNVFRAQGALEDNRKKLLEELRAVLHISHDRHSAEARRVSNDEVLATIAEQLSGPNTGLGWIIEGRRKIPLMPRGIAQTMYTEIADKVQETTVEENKELQKKMDAEELAAPKSNEEEISDPATADAALQCNESMEEIYPPVAMEDNSAKIWETELICRKRKIPESSVSNEDISPPVKNMRNIPVNVNQKHLNISQVYSKYSQPTISKSSSQSKHSYNQVSKLSSSKSSQTQAQRSQHRHRTHKPRMPKSHKKSQEIQMSPNKQYNPVSMQLEYSGPPNSFQATYAQSILGNKNKSDYIDEMKTKVKSSPGMVSESPTMHLLSQPATVPHELGVSENAHPDDHSSLQAQSTPIPKQNAAGKQCQLLIKNRSETDKKVQMQDFKIVQKPNDNIKILSNRQVVVAPSSTQKALNTRKLVTTKVIGSIPKGRSSTTPVKSMSEKMVVVSKPIDNRISHPKFVITSSSSTSMKNPTISANNLSPPTSEPLTPKGIPATDLKVSAKTFVLNPKSGQKMVVLPAKTSKEGQVPLFHFKGIPTAMKLVSVSSQPNTPVAKLNPGIATPKPSVPVPSSTKIVGVEQIKTANLADIVPVKGTTPVATQKITNPIVRPVNTKGNVIVVPKGATIGKALTFTKNGNDMSKIIMGKNVNKLLQAKSEQGESSKSGNVIVLELNNEQSGRTTTMSEILDSRVPNTTRSHEESKQDINQTITQDTPVLFENQIAVESCNTASLDSATSMGDIVPMEEGSLGMIVKNEEPKSTFSQDTEVVKDSSSVTDWEMELETVTSRKEKVDDKLNSLHLDLGMSSESESEYMVDSGKNKSEHSSQDSIQQETRGMSSEIYSGSGLSLATRTLLSQLQDEGSSSNDSSFALKSKKPDKAGEGSAKADRSESDALSKAKAKLTQKVAEAQSQQKRIDVYSTAITTSEINLESFSYLDESLMAGDDEFPDSKREPRRNMLDEQLSRLLGEDSANSSDSQTVSERLPLTSNDQ
ncbi:BRCA2-interacting transcriptional repressor EMSY [Zerene cesonia]|uniref:BRCA2-interacting transcriptional repressor EMSY n=1 Tax=Zerene cesonia TaxID=33412 RepID=UPI0018E56860|nr:BRCA2-interacting transcriptional repressor EMSY [Zerene cesonia]